VDVFFWNTVYIILVHRFYLNFFWFHMFYFALYYYACDAWDMTCWWFVKKVKSICTATFNEMSSVHCAVCVLPLSWLKILLNILLFNALLSSSACHFASAYQIYFKQAHPGIFMISYQFFKMAATELRIYFRFQVYWWLVFKKVKIHLHSNFQWDLSIDN